MMNREDAIALLKGKVLADIDCKDSIGTESAFIAAIVFTDGTRLELLGDEGPALIASIQLANGTLVDVEH